MRAVLTLWRLPRVMREIWSRNPQYLMEADFTKIVQTVFGAPKHLKDPHLFHAMSLIPILAWVGLGADGLSSSAYGPEEAFKALGSHTYLAVAGGGDGPYRLHHLLRLFPDHRALPPRRRRLYRRHAPLGEKAGVVSGSALLVDYVMTITISIASCVDALFSYFRSTTITIRCPLPAS